MHRHRVFLSNVRVPWLTNILGSLSGLGSQATARQGNALGMLGVSSGILASLAAVGFPVEVLTQFAAVAAIGGTVGTLIGKRITATELPQMVLHFFFVGILCL